MAVALLLWTTGAGCQQQTVAKSPPEVRTVTVRQGPGPVQVQEQAPSSAPGRAPAVPDPGDPFAGARQVASSFDPCADRLHEISGMLLVYYAQFHRLPDRLEDLGPASGTAGAAAADPDTYYRCPASGKRYVYNPAGPPIGTGKTGSHLIVYDAVPAHEGARWGIAVAEPMGNEPLIARVIVIPETMLPVAVPAPDR